MKPWYHKFFVLLIIFELVGIAYLSFNLYHFFRLKNIYAYPLSIKNITNNSSALKFFYEPIGKGTGEEDSLPWLPEKILYTFNSDGLNERFEYPIIKSSGVFRILAMGDSFTFGLFVNPKDNWVEALEDSLNQKCSSQNNKYEIINLAMGGYDIQYSIERYKIRGEKYQPDLIIWFLKDDDFEEINEAMREKEKYYTQQLSASGKRQQLIKKGVAYPEFVPLHKKMYQLFQENQREILLTQKNILLSFNQIYKGKLLLITFPFVRDNYKTIIKNLIRERKNSSWFYDELPNVYTIPNASFMPYDGHPNKKGYKLISDNLYEYLLKSNIVPCN